MAPRLVSTALHRLPEGLHPDGRGLYLQVKNDSRSWLFRFMIHGKGRWMGLRRYPDVSLAQARKAADDARRLLRDGVDPIEARKQQRQAAKLDAAQAITFETCATEYIEAHRAEWRNPKHAAQWTSTLQTYAYPVIGSLPVQAVDTAFIVKVLQPIWLEKTETASRVRQRIEVILNWATTLGYRSGDNPARWRGHLDNLLARPTKIKAVKHHEAMPYAVLPEFYAKLSKHKTISAQALIFTILTAARSGETRGATVSEIDEKNEVWTIPGKRTKSRREYRVPLTMQAMRLLRSLAQFEGNRDALLFPNPQGRALSDTAMRKYLQEDMKQLGLTVHGFRSTFRDWAAEQTNFPREVAEASLAHVLRDKTEAAYQRKDMLDRRRKLMEEWANYCASRIQAGSKIVAKRRI